MISRKTPNLAKHEAITTTLGLVFSSFAIALAVALGVPPLISSVLRSNTTDPEKTIITVITGLTTSVFFMWFSSDRIKTTVGLAIDSAVSQTVEKYEEENPNIGERKRIQLQEYTCAIPNAHRSEIAVRLSNPNQVICDRRVGRDAVTRSLSYNDQLLKGIALAAADEVLDRIHGKGKAPKAVREIFLTDIYAYLKAWLMLSIAHDHVMPVRYIRQRYPTEQNPDKEAYSAALEFVKKRSIRNPTVSDAMTKILVDQYAIDQAKNLLDEYLTILISELKGSSN